MNQDPTKRKLTAILSADVVGYSRLMEADESWTIQNLEENKKIMSSLIEELNGRVVDSPGDNMLAEFSSVINAVECAFKIQKELNAKNSKLMEDHRMNFRIGVNLGDVIEEDGRIYGNGVNIAARLEGLAEPGGICISHNAYDQVKSKIDVDYDYLGEYEVKNINEPVRVYRILMEGDSANKYVPQSKLQKIINPISVLIAVILLLVAALVATITVLYPKPKAPSIVTRFFVELPEGSMFGDMAGPHLALSPDGNRFAVSTTNGIYLRSMNEWNIKQIAGTMGNTRQPFFSPDSESIGYWSMDDNQLKRVSVTGGEPVSLCKDDISMGYYHWGTDGNIYYANGNGIMRVPENGGDPENIIASNDGEGFYSPQLMPDGKSVMFTLDSDEGYKIAVQQLNADDRKILFRGATALYLPTGHLIYTVDNDLNAVPFDIDKLETTDRPVPVVRDILVNGPPHFCVSNSGTFAYLRNMYTNRSLVWVNFDGREEELNTISPDTYESPRISPDGDYIALSATDNIGDSNIGILDIGRKNIVRLNQNMPYNWNPIWTPDSDNRGIVFCGQPEDVYPVGIYRVSSSGTGEIEHLYTEPMRQIVPESLSKDGKILLCQVRQPNNSNIVNLGMLTIDEDPQWKLLLDDKYKKRHPRFSPDNEWIAYTSDISGQEEVYIRSFPEVDKERKQISTDGGNEPLWSPNSQQLYYRNEDRVIAVTYETKQGFKVVKSEVLFQGTYSDGSGTNNPSWDIHPDGKRFLMMKETATDSKGERSRPRIFIIENWFEELKKRVPMN